jgi:hypothetical protein
VAASLAALHDDDVGAELLGLLGVARCPAGGHADDARVLEPLDQPRVGRAVVAGGLHPVADDRVGDHVGAGCVHQEVHTEGPVGELLDLLDLPVDLFGADRGRGEEAEGSGVAHRRRQLRRRHPAHPRLDDRVGTLEEVADRRVEAGGHGGMFSWLTL